MSGETEIRPFRADIPEEEVVELRRRVAATRWPDPETVSDQSQGAQLAKVQELVRYWGTDYDWRNGEAKLNALPQFMTQIDGLDIYFIHARSAHEHALPMIMTHGWPGSVFELLKTVGPLTDPTAHGGQAEDAFHLVLPSMPGFGFSGKPASTGWGPERMGRAWDELMRRLGYGRYVSQGGDWGGIVTHALARQAPPGLLAIHTNFPETVPPEIAKALQSGDPAPAGLSPDEKSAYEQLTDLVTRGSGYAAMLSTRPQTEGYGLTDSPVGLAAFFYEKFAAWTDSGGEPERVLTYDEMLDDITLYWLTNTATSAARLYWEKNPPYLNAVDISIPAAVSVFPGEVYQAPRSWAERAYHNLIYFNQAGKGGHFAAWEQPQLFSEEVRAAFRSLRQLTVFERLHMPSLGVAAGLRGHVVLVDFWTLTCISWPRTEPYLRAWSQSYRNDGLAVIGIHTPEFSFEHEIDRVRQAAKERGIDPPAQARTWCPSVPVVTERPPTGTA